MKTIFVIFSLLIFQSLAKAQEQLDVIQVLEHSADEQSLVDFIPSVTRLRGKELQKRRQATIGDTLQSEAGVATTSFGPNASRPVIRGLDGARIRILQNSLSILDASTQSLDHNIPIDPLLVDQIEIVRGPMSLLYGSSAVGGVVNIVTNRTHSQYQEGVLSEFQTQGETVNNGISNSARLDYGVNNWMLHFDGATKNLGDQKIPSHSRSKRERKESPLAPGEREEKDKLENSFSKQDTLGTGFTRFFDKGHLGLSFSNFVNDYGSVVEKEVSIEMIQNRFEMVGEYRLGGSFEKVKIRSAQSDYRHKEIDDGETGTIFKNKGNETRIELVNKNEAVKGVTGVQTQIFKFTADGDEAFLPPSDNKIVSFFTFQKLGLSKGHAVSTGGRIESSSVKQISSDHFGESDEFGFTAFSGSTGYLHKLTTNHALALNYSYTERAPTFQELLSGGEHVATGTYEEGDRGLTKEKAHALELNFKRAKETSTWTASLYTQRFEDYISLNPSGADDIDSGFPIFEYNQVNAIFYGLDVDGREELTKTSAGSLNLIGRFDLVRGKDTQRGENLPRLSPPRITTGLELTSDRWTHDAEVQYVFEQTKTAPVERTTERYILTNLGTRYGISGKQSRFEVFLRVRNLFDVDARNHVSFLKEIAPLPGRNFIAGANLLF